MDPSSASTTTTTTTTFLRRYLEELEDLYTGKSGFDDGSSSSTVTASQTSAVFWGVNGFITFLLIILAVWCCFSRKEILTNPDQRRREADREYQRTLRERQERRQNARTDTPEKRTRKLIKSFRKHEVVMVVKNEDLIEHSARKEAELDEEGDIDLEASSSNSLSSQEQTGYLKLTTGRLVPNCCAVCLGSYDEGDKVVWSSNKDCQHAFHVECVVGWLVKFQPETPCPCCRQEFTDLEKMRQEAKIVWSGPAFNLGSVALR